ncbi:MAG TPA: signal peptidase II [Rhabdochlamydiaceae bacterium]|nr:signal peptidase II [Rhabdochlamydiaceae bacterium]
MKRALKLVAIAFVILCLDFFSKAYVQSHIPLINYSSPFFPYGGIGVFHNWHGIDFSINHVINKGAAWGILSSFQQYLLYFRILVIGGMLTYVFFLNKSHSKNAPFMLIISGAVGNVIDYFIYGHVVDMFHFKFGSYVYPVFNVADSSIFCGIAWLLIQSFMSKAEKKLGFLQGKKSS